MDGDAYLASTRAIYADKADIYGINRNAWLLLTRTYRWSTHALLLRLPTQCKDRFVSIPIISALYDEPASTSIHPFDQPDVPPCATLKISKPHSTSGNGSVELINIS